MDSLRSDTTVITQSLEAQLDARDSLWSIFHSDIMPDAEKERNAGLFIRSSMLARLLALTEVYKKIVDIPGCIADFGTWRGQNFILCENLRAIYEPFNKQRKVFAFDTFDGYLSSGEKDQVAHDKFQDGKYSTGEDYPKILEDLMNIHESINVLSNMKTGHRVIKGDVTETLPLLLKEQKNISFSLAFFDMNLEGPTRFALEKILERAVPGAHLVFMQMQRDFLPGEGVAYLSDILHKRNHKISRAKEYPSMNIIELL